MNTPGASSHSVGPKLLPHQFSPSDEVRVLRSSFGLEAPTVTYPGRLPGKSLSIWSLPDAMQTIAPLPPRPCVRARPKARLIASLGGPPPHEFDSTEAPLR